jgi:hypothetical protein
MKQANKWIQRVALGALVVLPLSACGESESNGSSEGSSGGSGGTAGNTTTTSAGGSSSGGTSTTGEAGGGNDGPPQSMMCDGTLCEGLSLGIVGGPQTDACCPENSPDEPCGVRTDFLEEYNVDLMRECQPLNSPGELDPECPDSPPLMPNETLSLPGFPGCCLPSGKCGFLLDEALLGAVQLNLGCIDSRELPNPDFDNPPDCDPGAAGAGGSP